LGALAFSMTPASLAAAVDDSERNETAWPGALVGMTTLGADLLTPLARASVGCLRSMLGGNSPSSALCGPKPWHSKDECRCLRVQLYLPPQASDEHVDVAITELRAVLDNGMTQRHRRQLLL